MEKYRKLILGILKELMIIPAPSGHEDKRAEYCLEKLREFGFENAYVDNAKNVIVEWGEGEETVIYAAHTDVVFPDTDVLPYTEDKKYIRCPGCGDDTVAVSMLMVSMKKLIEENGESGDNLLVIGDGKVEIALGAQHNAFTLGVATDEENRCGINPVKRKRLKNAGADAIIGDFENIEELLNWLK